MAAGDVNGDGLRRHHHRRRPGRRAARAGVQRRGPSQLASFFAYDPAFGGGVSVAAGDVNGDGRADIVTGAGPGGGPHVRVFAASDLAELASFFAFDPAFSGGVFLGSVAGGAGRLRFTSEDATTFAAGVAGTFAITTEGGSGPITLTATGALPSGVTFTDNGDGTATLAGTPDAGTGGTYPLTFTGTAVGPPVTQSFTLTVEQAPAITSPTTTTFTVSIAGTFTVNTTGAPPRRSARPARSPGRDVPRQRRRHGDARGHARDGTAGTYPLAITAANGVNPAAIQSFTLIVVSTLPPTLDPIADPRRSRRTPGADGQSDRHHRRPRRDAAAAGDRPRNNLALIPNPTVTYTSPNTTGSLTYTPARQCRHGTAIVTVTVTDGGLDGNLATPGDNATFSRQFTVTVTASTIRRRSIRFRTRRRSSRMRVSRR